MAALTVQTIPRNGSIVNITLSAASAGGDTFVNDGETFVLIKNGAVGAVAITVTAQGDPKYAKAVDATGSITNGEYGIAGPFDGAGFGSTVTVDTDDETSIEIAAIKFTEPTP